MLIGANFNGHLGEGSRDDEEVMEKCRSTDSGEVYRWNRHGSGEDISFPKKQKRGVW